MPFGDVFNVHDYGAVGDGVNDDTAEIQVAIAAAAAAGGGAVFFPDGLYAISSGLALSSGIVLRLGVNAVLDASGLADDEAAVRAVGEVTATSSTLSANAVVGDGSVVVSSPAGFATDDWCLLRSEAITGSVSLKAGEIVRISSVAGSTVLFQDPLADSYATSDTATLVKLALVVNVGVEGGAIEGSSDPALTVDGVRFDYCVNAHVAGVRFRRTHWHGIHLVSCSHARVHDCHFSEILGSGLAYGVGVSNASQDVTVSGCTGYRMRHLFTAGGLTAVYGVPRRVTVSGCTASQMIDAGLDAHPGCSDIVFTGNTVAGSDQDGIVMQASRAVVSGNIVRGVARHGILVQGKSAEPMEMVVAENSISGCGGRAILFDLTDAAWRDVEGISITGNVCSGSSGGIFVDSNAAPISGCAITGNRVTVASNDGIFLDGVNDFSLTGNVVRGCVASGDDGIYAVDSSGGVISANDVKAVSSSGTVAVRVNESAGTSERVAIVGNVATGAATGVMLANSVDYCSIVGNVLRGNTTPISAGAGVGHQVSANVT